MKSMILTLAVCFAANAFALDALPNGHWVGEGHGSMANGTPLKYHEELTVENNTSTSVLTLGPETGTYVMKHTFKPGGFTDVSIEERAQNRTIAGNGYCGSIWCHVESNDHTFEMTYVFEPNGGVYELGSDTEQGQKGWFESSLTKK